MAIKGIFQGFVKNIYRQLFTRATFLADLSAGLTVALILIPQSLAYAELAGLPVQYGLYSSLLPVTIGAIFGSSRFLSTGPVAIVSLITASALSTLPTRNASDLIGYAILLAFLTGLIQIALAFLRLGKVLRFVSHPVLIGFSNAAALIIASSQLPKLFGVPSESYEHHYQSIYEFFSYSLRIFDIASVAMAAIAIIIVYFLKKFAPKLPAILIAVAICTYISSFGFEQRFVLPMQQITSPVAVQAIQSYNQIVSKIEDHSRYRDTIVDQIGKLRQQNASLIDILELESVLTRIDIEKEELEQQAQLARRKLWAMRFTIANDGSQIQAAQSSARSLNTQDWRLHINEGAVLHNEALSFKRGGSIVGRIPVGLPTLAFPTIEWSILSILFNHALIIAVLGFMEAASISKSLAVKTGDRISTNKELIGQGMANLVGSLTQSYPVAGSFTRTAVNFQSGAQTKLASVFVSIFVLLTMLFFTQYLYYLPQPVLAAIIVMSVVGLFHFGKMREAWNVQKSDGAIAIITFVATLFFAPHLDQGIMLGVLLSSGYYIYTRSRPRVSVLTPDKKRELKNAVKNSLAQCLHTAIIRFDGSLFFANAEYLEKRIFSLVRMQGKSLKSVILIAEGINYIDYSGVEVLSDIFDELKESHIELSIVRLKDHIANTLKAANVYQKIDKKQIFISTRDAVRANYDRIHSKSSETHCPLKHYIA